MAEIIILGAGLTGLSAAYHLEKNNFFDFVIFEKDSTPGGLVRSVVKDGFTFDYTGHLLHSNNAYFSQFLADIFPPNSLNKLQRKSFVYTHNRFVPYPFQMNLKGLPADVIIECLCGFAKRKHANKNPKNFREWVLAYFGSGIAKHFFFPYNSKLLCSDLSDICPSWTGNFVPRTTLASIFDSFSEPPANNVGYNNSFLYPKQGGIQSLINSLQNNIKTKPVCNHAAVNIDLKNKTVSFANGKTEKFQHLISTLPLPELLRTLSTPTTLTIKEAQHKLRCNSVINYNLGITQENFTDKHWIYTPEKQFPFYRVGFWHNFSTAMARPGSGSIYGEIAYLSQNKNFESMQTITQQAIDQTLQILNLSRRDVATECILHLPYAYVIYDAWREKNLPALHRTLNAQQIYSVGRYGCWNYSSMQDAVLYGHNVAQQLCNQKSASKFIPAKTPSQQKVVPSYPATNQPTPQEVAKTS